MSPEQTSAGVSVLICTRNGVGTLGPVLEALAANRSPRPRELLLVDNASTDGVGQFAEETWRGLGRPFPLRVLSEPRPGKSFAFFTGIQAATHELIVLCDDDNVLAEDYLDVAAELMADPSVGAVGGAGAWRGEGVLPAHALTFSPWLGFGGQLRDPSDVEFDPLDITSRYPDMALWGAGLVLRRSDMRELAAIDGFPTISGEFKCEDSELCHALVLMGRRLLYTPRLRFEHLVAIERMEPWRLMRRFSYDQAATPIMSCYVQLRRNLFETRWKTVTRVAWRALRAGLISAPVRPLVFGALARCGLSWAMKPTERRIYEIGRRLERLRRAQSAGAETAA